MHCCRLRARSPKHPPCRRNGTRSARRWRSTRIPTSPSATAICPRSAASTIPSRVGAGQIPFPIGGMGIHFLNPELIAPVPDPMRPTILLYEPNGDKLRLVGAEWSIPLSTGVKERPSLFGQPSTGRWRGMNRSCRTECTITTCTCGCGKRTRPGCSNPLIRHSHAQATDIPWRRTGLASCRH